VSNKQPGRAKTVDSINKEDVHTTLIVRWITGKEEELDEVLKQRHIKFPVFSDTEKKLQ